MLGGADAKRRLLAMCATLILGLTVLPLVGPLVGADSTFTMGETLPSARYDASAVWDGSNVYVFGGGLDQILRYNPTTDTATVMTATLPSSRVSTSAIWDGSNAYIFGGDGGSGLLNQIIRYHPATDAVTTMTAILPSARYSTSAVWDGSNAYIFGGSDSGGILNQIIRYNPATDTVTTMAAILPSALFQTSAVWDGSNVYVFSGNQIIRYNPGTDTVATMAATLPSFRRLTSAVWDGSNAYIFGGYGSSYLDEIVRYDPGADVVTTMAATLPSARAYTSAVWDGSNAYVFGGFGGSALDEIVRYDFFTSGTLVSQGIVNPANLGVLEVCDSGSVNGCGTPGTDFLCINLVPPSGSPVNLACIDHSLVPPQLDAILHGPSLAQATITYTYDRFMLDPVTSLLGGTVVVCAPVPSTAAGVAWIQENADGVPLVITVNGPTGPTTVSLPGVGQVVAAALATAGLIPC